MLDKTLSFVMAQFLQCYTKKRSKKNESCFATVSDILFTKQIFGWHFFQREIECFIECLIECVNECVKVPIPAHQVLPLTVYIFEASYSTSATHVNKI